MADYWDVGQFKETKNGNNRFVKLGYASEKKGGGFYVHLDCLPLPEMSERIGKLECQFVIVPPKGTYGGKVDEPRRDSPPFNSRLGTQAPPDDFDVPF